MGDETKNGSEFLVTVLFAPNFLIFRITLAKSQEEEGEEEEHRQLQSVMRFTQTQ